MAAAERGGQEGIRVLLAAGAVPAADQIPQLAAELAGHVHNITVRCCCLLCSY
jgi:hypothetical protein